MRVDKFFMNPNEDIMRAIGRIEGTMSQMLEEQKSTNTSVRELFKITNQHQSYIDNQKGKIAVMSSVFGVVAATLFEFVKTRIGIK